MLNFYVSEWLTPDGLGFEPPADYHSDGDMSGSLVRTAAVLQ
jgi:hypothetical protein